MMKKYYLFAVLLVFVSLSAQTPSKKIQKMVSIEKKSAAKKMNLVNNQNTSNYDITYHRLKLTVDPAIYFVSGEVTTKFIAKEDLNTVTFDLSNNLAVSSVKQRGNDLSFSRSLNNELVINLPSLQNINVLDSLSITYSGVPPSNGFGSFSIDKHNEIPVLWTLSEPFGARDWWPCKQDLNDKINNIDVFITAPSQYVSVSNGLEQSKINNGNSTTTTHFKHNYPIPAYLIAIAVTNYQIHNQQAGLGTTESPFFPIVNYCYPETATKNIESVAPTPDILNFFETKFGPYPFRNEKYGHAEFSWGGGMEHTTVSFMTAYLDGEYSRDLIGHELAHQWFGNKVTCGSWNDIWLNEGFATYLNAMAIAFLDGDEKYIEEKGHFNDFIASEPDGALYLSAQDALNVNVIFDYRLSYIKGAMVLNMLRFKLGDTNFFRALRNYLNDPLLAYGYAKTPDLQKHFETTSGLNLNEFFSDWVYNQGFPSYDVTATNLNSEQAKITINQKQSHASVDFFEMPVPVRLIGANGQQQDYVLEHSSNGQQFVVNVPFTVAEVSFDPKNELISDKNTVSLSISGFDISKNVQMFLNSSNTILNVEVSNNLELQNLMIYNAVGQNVGVFYAKQVPLEQLSKGVYFVKIFTSEGTVTKKLIKK